jgi:ParB-like chromosome segregation protein Spo0J
VDILKVHPRNTEFFDDISGEEYERFKKSIETDGLLSPLVVAPDMTIISGHQRLKACRELGYKTVPVIIQDSIEDDDDKLRKLIAANFGRLKNDPIKQSKLITEYEKLCGVQHGGDRKSNGNNLHLTQEDIAKQLGVDTRTLRDLKRLQTLSPDLQEIVSSGQITPTTGFKVLAKLSESEQQQLLSMLPAAQKLTQAQVQEYVDQLQEKDNVIAGYKIKLESKNESMTIKSKPLRCRFR